VCGGFGNFAGFGGNFAVFVGFSGTSGSLRFLVWFVVFVVFTVFGVFFGNLAVFGVGIIRVSCVFTLCSGFVLGIFGGNLRDFQGFCGNFVEFCVDFVVFAGFSVFFRDFSVFFRVFSVWGWYNTGFCWFLVLRGRFLGVLFSICGNCGVLWEFGYFVDICWCLLGPFVVWGF